VSATEWALSAAARFAEQERVKSEQWARALQRHQIITAQASRFWGEIRQALHAQVDTFNEQVGKQVLVAPMNGEDKLAVYAQAENGPRTLTAEFEPRIPSIRCSARTEQGSVDFEARFPIELEAGGNKLIALASEMECSAEEVAGRMLNGLMGWK
jgi:hypothetical protein